MQKDIRESGDNSHPVSPRMSLKACFYLSDCSEPGHANTCTPPGHFHPVLAPNRRSRIR